MSRTMIEANEWIFSALVELVKESKVPAEDLDCIRYIGTNSTEKEWLAELKVIKRQSVVPGRRTASLRFKEREYLAVVGWSEAAGDEGIISPIEMNAGLLTALLFELEVPVRQGVAPTDIIQTVIPQCMGAEGYSGHDFDIIAPFFDAIIVYEIADDSPLRADDLERLTCLYLCKNPGDLPLPLAEETIQILQRIFLEGVPSVPYENLMRSLNAVYSQFAFLDLYRCLERLFCIPKLDDLHQKLSVPMSLSDFSVHIERVIKWHPPEEDALRNLFLGMPPDADALLRDVKEATDGNRDGDLAEWFYKIRNSIVHHRPGSPKIDLDLDGQNWDMLLRATLLIIDSLYKKYDEKLGG